MVNLRDLVGKCKTREVISKKSPLYLQDIDISHGQMFAILEMINTLSSVAPFQFVP
jgi:hypothetical protein